MNILFVFTHWNIRLQYACGKSLLLIAHNKAGRWPEATVDVPSRNGGCLTPWLPRWETSRYRRTWICNFSCKQGAKRDGGTPVQQAGFALPLPPQWYINCPYWTRMPWLSLHGSWGSSCTSATERSPLYRTFTSGWGLRWFCLPAAGHLGAISGVLYWHQDS